MQILGTKYLCCTRNKSVTNILSESTLSDQILEGKFYYKIFVISKLFIIVFVSSVLANKILSLVLIETNYIFCYWYVFVRRSGRLWQAKYVILFIRLL